MDQVTRSTEPTRAELPKDSIYSEEIRGMRKGEKSLRQNSEQHSHLREEHTENKPPSLTKEVKEKTVL